MNTIQKKIGYGRGPGGQSKSCVKIKKNVTEKDIEKSYGKWNGMDTFQTA